MKDLIQKSQEEICKGGTYKRTGGNLGITNIFDWSIGSITMQVADYNVTWEASGVPSLRANFKHFKIDATRSISFVDRYQFDPTKNLKQFITDKIPSLVAGNGTPYTISGSWEDKITFKFSACCP